MQSTLNLRSYWREAAHAFGHYRAIFSSMIGFIFFCHVVLLAQAAPPNIVLMMGDDHGWEETGYNGHPHVKTPVLDEMAATGFRFDRFYSAHPSCSPTRASFLTGRHPNRMGTYAPGWSFRPQEITIAHILNNAGYRCGHFGKWHVGAVKKESPVSPGAMGFHEWVSHDNFFELNPTLSRNGGPPEEFKGESSEVIVNEAMRFIDGAKQADKPFFTVVWFGSPHEPYSGLPDDLALYDDLPATYSKKVQLTSNETGGSVSRPQGEVLRERYAEITAMDRAIGKLRAHLAAQQLRDNTLLFYCGDNGTSPDAALGAPHRGAKGQVYEGGVLVPGLIEWPARIPQPRVSNVRATTSDLLPTVCALTGQPLPDRLLDGADVSAALDGQMTQRPNPLYFWEYNTSRFAGANPKPYLDPELQTGTTPLAKLMGGKATRNFTNWHQPAITEADYRGPRAIIDGNYKLVVHEPKNGQVRRELFDLAADPAEKTNLLDQQTAQADQLQSKMRSWQESVLTSVSDPKIGKLPASKVLFLGNSITLHGPAPKIGWNGNWGMAASAQDKDYVHILSSQIAKASGGTPAFKVKNVADFERTLNAYNVRDQLKDALDFQADIIVLAIGENAAPPKTDEAKTQFATAFKNLLSELKAHGEPAIFVRSQFWSDAEKDQLMKKASEEIGATFIDVSQLGSEESNYARAEQKFEHTGVAAHPGDKGMQALADAIWQAIEKQARVD